MYQRSQYAQALHKGEKSMAIARVQPRGQVTIPKRIREACGIEPGSDLIFIQTGPHTFQCYKLPDPRPLLETIERLTVPGTAPDMRELREQIGDDIAREVLGDHFAPEAEPTK
jgi:AbrB family looped-hinge helix DNA binding protein